MTPTEGAVRRAAVAGTFYPADPAALAAMVDRLLEGASPESPDRPRPNGEHPKALIVPHAGYRYSGPIAASAYATLRGAAYTRVILLGPAHRVALEGIAAPGANAFATPLGLVRVDQAARTKAAGCAGVTVSDVPHLAEHSLEVQLPFLQPLLGDVPVLPLAVGHASAETVADLLDALWGGPETLIVISTDLSHYLSYETARKCDRRTADAIVAADPAALGPHDACGYYPLRGFLTAAARRGLTCDLLDLRNSGDTEGDRDQVVGYGAFAWSAPASHRPFSREEWATLAGTAESAIRSHLLHAQFEPADLSAVSSALRRHGASFVTLEREGALLGCRGTIAAHQPLIRDVANNAVLTAFADPRFPPLAPADFEQMTIKLSVLTPPEPLPARSWEEALAMVRPGRDGLLVVDAGRRGTLLPAVWRQVPDAREFMECLWQKAGLRLKAWTGATTLLRYETVEYTALGPRTLS